jgi:hypothetical protein
MPTVVDAARLFLARNVVWRRCRLCGELVALPDGLDLCAGCGGIERLRSRRWGK